MSTKIVTCKCKDQFQDQVYGAQQRVANRCKPNSTAETHRCTKCGAEHTKAKS